jgi:integrase
MAYRGLRCGALPSLTTLGGKFTAASKGKDISGEIPAAALAAIETAGLSLKQPFAGTVTNNLEKNIEYYMKKMYKAGELKAIYCCHSFRHFFAVTEYKKDHDIHRVKELLGHSSIAITDKYLKSLGAL